MQLPPWALTVTALALAACPRPPASAPAELAAGGVHRIPIDVGDAHGLSGLALAGDGALWTVAERAQAAFRLELDLAASPPTVRSIRRWDIDGLPPGVDLESLAALPGGGFLIGTEGRGGVRAHRVEPAGDRLAVRGPPVEVTRAALGVKAGGNQGFEAACAVPGRVVLGIEAVGTDRQGRWAPLVIVTGEPGDPAATTTVRRLRLTTRTGKLSALDCWSEGGRLRVVAIERHFEVTRVLGFELDDGTGAVVPTLIRDLEPVLHGALNLEGIVRLPDGRLLAVVDNHYGRVTGPAELVWLDTAGRSLSP
jgi:hypothetical protein